MASFANNTYGVILLKKLKMGNEFYEIEKFFNSGAKMENNIEVFVEGNATKVSHFYQFRINGILFM